MFAMVELSMCDSASWQNPVSQENGLLDFQIDLQNYYFLNKVSLAINIVYVSLPWHKQIYLSTSVYVHVLAKKKNQLQILTTNSNSFHNLYVYTYMYNQTYVCGCLSKSDSSQFQRRIKNNRSRMGVVAGVKVHLKFYALQIKVLSTVYTVFQADLCRFNTRRWLL